MARATFDVFERYVGAGNLSAYTFDFKITTLSQLLIKEYSAAGALLQEVRGTDVVYLSSVTFDANDGGGTVNLAANLVAGRILYILLAPDDPTQSFEFRNRSDFTLKRLEDALDFVAGPIQRAMYLALRSIKLPDFIASADFDPTLPVDLIDSPQQCIVTNAAGDGLEMGPSISEIANAESYAEAAELSAISAAASALAAQATNVWTEHAVVDGQAATVLTNETVDLATYCAALYSYHIRRGSGASEVVTSGHFSLQFQNATARIRMGQDMGDLGGVTLDCSQVGTVASLRAALDVGAGNGFISLSRKLVPV